MTARPEPWPESVAQAAVPSYQRRYLGPDALPAPSIYHHACWFGLDRLRGIAAIYVDVKSLVVPPHACLGSDAGRHGATSHPEACHMLAGESAYCRLASDAMMAWAEPGARLGAWYMVPEIEITWGYGCAKPVPGGPWPALPLLPRTNLEELSVYCDRLIVRAKNESAATEPGVWQSRIAMEVARRAKHGEPRLTWDQGMSVPTHPVQKVLAA